MNEIWAAIITGIFGLLTGLLVGFKDDLKQLFSKSNRKLNGTWAGIAYDLEVPEKLNYKNVLRYEISAKIEQSGRKISGQFTSKSDRTVIIEFKGELRDDVLLVNYKNYDKNIVDYGYALLKVLGTGKDLDGFFIGKRMREDGFVVGKIELKME